MIQLGRAAAGRHDSLGDLGMMMIGFSTIADR
jgi:hypothetical protein